MRDLIDRQAAIDVLSLGKEILSRVLDDIDVVDTDREKYSWGLELIDANIKDIEELPSAQPQPIVRCKDCKHADDDGVCQNSVGLVIQDDDDFCSRAERRTDGSD